MKKNWQVKLPADLLIDNPYMIKDLFATYTGTIYVTEDMSDGFLSRTRIIGGEHESDDAGSQLAVVSIVDLVSRHSQEKQRI